MSYGVALAFADAGIRIIPAKKVWDGRRWSKRPHIKHWRELATTDPSLIGEWWTLWPEALVGIVLEHYGRVVVDCDRHDGHADGIAAFEALGNFPPHPIVRSAGGGFHHYFKQPDPPIEGTAFADGIDLLGTSRFVVAPGSGGYQLVADCEAPELPEVFCKAGSKSNHGSGLYRGPSLVSLAMSLSVRRELSANLLSRLDPTDYRNHSEWLRLMMSCHSAGIDREAFIEWSTSDPNYAGDGDVIGERWDSLKVRHVTGATLFWELRTKATQATLNNSVQGHIQGQATTTAKVTLTGRATGNLRNRTTAILRSVETAKSDRREPALFRAACTFREIIFEGLLNPDVALKVLESACRINGLWADPDKCRETIAAGYLTVELKLLAKSKEE